jgi:hypothetical protein
MLAILRQICGYGGLRNGELPKGAHGVVLTVDKLAAFVLHDD